MLRKSFLIPIFFLLIIFIVSLINCISIQQTLASKVLRLHILANSNSTYDQELKLKVRNDIVEFLTPKLEKSKNILETKEIISKNLSEIQLIAENSISQNSKYKVAVSLDTSVFPTKHYSTFSFPAGKYEALKIVIGEGAGNNWWCVMFPPLCFTNSSAGEFDEKSEKTLKESLSKEEYDLISNPKNKEVKVKFRLLEWWNS